MFELASHWRRFRVISSLVARVMIVSVREVQAARQLDLRALFEFLGISYLELRLNIFIEYIKLIEGSLLKVSEFLKMFLRVKDLA